MKKKQKKLKAGEHLECGHLSKSKKRKDNSKVAIPRAISTAKKRWQKIDSEIQFYDAPELRKFYAAALKFLIPRRNWNDPHPITEFDKDSVIQCLHSGFEEYSRTDMEGTEKALSQDDSDLLEKIRKAANLKGKHPSKKLRKKKLRDLRGKMAIRLKHYIQNEDQPLRGVRFYEKVIRNTYLT